MNKSIVTISLIILNMKTVDSSSFCADPEDYECKHLGITKCVPKLNRSTTQKPLPIEKPPCAVPCLDTDSWCEERGACIAQDEHCDCGPDKIYCTSEDAYSCESRKGILQSNIFNICRNGACRKNCSMAEEEGMEGGGGGQFRCGGKCLDNAPNVSSTTVNPSTILSTSTSMDAPNSTTSKPTAQVTSTTTTAPPSRSVDLTAPHTRYFDGLSFLGGILLTVGAAGLLMGGYKYFGPGRGDMGAYNRIVMKDLYGESDHLQV